MFIVLEGKKLLLFEMNVLCLFKSFDWILFFDYKFNYCVVEEFKE